jgi:hypothetical protein
MPLLLLASLHSKEEEGEKRACQVTEEGGKKSERVTVNEKRKI